MPGVNATITLDISAKQSGSGDLGTPQVLVDIAKSMEFSPGTAAVGQANVLFSDTRVLAASASENLDLAGALTDALGATIAAAEIVAVYVAAAAGNTNDVQVTRPAANGVPLFLAAGDGFALGPGDFTVRTYRNGVAVTAATGDLITITNGGAGTSVTYDIVVIGRTVAA
ncbi:MAG: hypothetical protein ACR652_17735 [Methylocystis sp.]|uniref:hypothetical protein n=1 Tax=Methylocystis sp. TaxID=1911079 RepID=UPI003DA4AC9F